MTWKPLKGESSDDPKPIGESLNRVASRLRLPPARVLRTIFRDWTELVGSPMAQHTRPLVLHNGELLVEVDEPGWATQVRYFEKELIDRCATVLGEGTVVRIGVRVRPRPVLG